jgi:hypothetical protein
MSENSGFSWGFGLVFGAFMACALIALLVFVVVVLWNIR